jgi:tetratricopeptide (TPR) repeat protein
MKKFLALIFAACAAAAWGQTSAPTNTPTSPPQTTSPTTTLPRSDAPAAAPAPATPQIEAPANPTLDNAEAAIQTNDLEGARKLLTKALAENANDPRALYDMGFVDDAQNNAAAAEQDYRKAVTIAPTIGEAHVALGKVLLEEGKSADARKEFEAVTAANSGADKHAQAQAWRALASMDMDSNTDRANDEIVQAATLEPNNPLDLLSAAELARRAGDDQAAEAAYRAVLKDQQFGVDAAANLCGMLIHDKRYADAETAAREALKLDPGNAVLTAQLAAAFAGQHKFAEALPLLKAAHDAHPGDEATTRMLANMENQSGDAAGASVLYAALIAQGHADSELLSSYGDSLVRQHRYAEAETALEKAVKLAPNDGDAWGALAFVYAGSKQYPEALNALTERAKYLPDNAPTLFLWASVYDHLQKKKEAMDYYKRFLAQAGGKFPNEEWQSKQRLAALRNQH